MVSRVVLLSAMSVLALVACSKDDVAGHREAQTEAQAESAPQSPGGPESLPVQDASNLPTQPDVNAEGAPTGGEKKD